MHRTWKQCRDHTVEMASETGATHHPVWHGLGQPVPVYGWFRYHAHIRQYKALMVERGVVKGGGKTYHWAVDVQGKCPPKRSARMSPGHVAHFTAAFFRITGCRIDLACCLAKIRTLCAVKITFQASNLAFCIWNSSSRTPKLQLKFDPEDVPAAMDTLPRDPVLDLMENSGPGRKLAAQRGSFVLAI